MGYNIHYQPHASSSASYMASIDELVMPEQTAVWKHLENCPMDPAVASKRWFKAEGLVAVDNRDYIEI